MRKNVSSIKQEIKDLRLKVLVHSYLYYVEGISILSDVQYDGIMMSLEQLQNSNKRISRSLNFYDNEFKDFKSYTGFNLPYNDDFIVNMVNELYPNRL